MRILVLLGALLLAACGADPKPKGHTHDLTPTNTDDDAVAGDHDAGDDDADQDGSEGDVDNGAGDDDGPGPAASNCELGTLDDTVHASTDEQVAALEGYTRIDHLTIESNDVTTLAPLHCLEQIDQTLWIDYTSITSMAGLEHLTSLGNELVIEGNEALTSLAGLEGVVHVGSAIWLEQNTTLGPCEVQRLQGIWNGNGVEATYISLGNADGTCP